MINIELPDFETDQVLKEAAKLHCFEMSDDVTILMNPGSHSAMIISRKRPLVCFRGCTALPVSKQIEQRRQV